MQLFEALLPGAGRGDRDPHGRQADQLLQEQRGGAGARRDPHQGGGAAHIR